MVLPSQEPPSLGNTRPLSQGQGNPFAADYSCDRGSREVEGKDTENRALQMELKAPE